MSAVDSGERQQDAYTRMWETYDNEWNFDDLDGYYEGWHDRDTGWYVNKCCRKSCHART